ncbi:L-aspartate oxidase [Microbacterium caowuchunii]|uniref:L-aspartate oxidase n=1 Tax=Microbacterium caowuchunii TaxID=2614638 RepID=UPI001780D0B0|nr:L-aspartate oxidase [Microbacterium caowuchunii]
MSRHVVVVGSGIAGLTAALRAERNGAEVTLVTKGDLDETATRSAQGGIAGVLTASDTTAAHLADTLTAGAGLADPAAARILVEEGPARIRDLIDAGVPFDRDDDGNLRRGLEGAHSHPRILHAGGDATGAAIERTLLDVLERSTVTVLEHAFLLDVVLVDGHAVGVEVLVSGARRTITADAVVLATGGAGRLYPHTTNPAVATGDGIAAALRAGAAVADLEFVQFHPTVLAVGTPFLISEAVRGEGAVLRDSEGRRFALDAHPDGELAPRDIVARAIAEQDGPVVLDATGLGAPDTAAFLAARFPTIDAVLRSRGLDWSREPVPVTPAAHYMMGGVSTDLAGRTTVPRLYAVGETARTGVHGANRLASNSLLEGAVFGARVGDAVIADAGTAWAGPAAGTPLAAVEPSAPDAPPFTRAALQQLMWNHAGLVRDESGLARATAVLAAWSHCGTDRPVDVAAREDANLLRVAVEVVAAARRRRGSVGAHVRRDETPSVPEMQEATAC